MNNVLPSDAQWGAFQSAFSESEKIVMLNLLKFRASADYSDFPGEAPCSGRDAFARYESRVAPLIESRGGRIIFSRIAKGTVIGPQGEDWDKVILVEYPSAKALAEMLDSAEYQSIAHHRSAATQDSRLIPTRCDDE